MTKQQAISIWGSGAAMARALGIRPQSLSEWPAVLSRRQTHEVLGALLCENRQADALILAANDTRQNRV